MTKRRLGKGIDALLQGRDLEQMESLSSVVSVPVGNLVASPHQPRKQFPPEALQELADSIREKGVIQPILAEPREDGSYEIIAGERRFRAAKLAGLNVVPVLPRSFTDEEKLEIALVENVHRQNLNPIEEAIAYSNLMHGGDLTQEKLAQRLGMNRSTIANALRLLKLPEPMLQSVSSGDVSAGHGRTLLKVSDETLRRRLFDCICEDGISVREAERIASDIEKGRGVAAFLGPAAPQPAADDPAFDSAGNGRSANRSGKAPSARKPGSPAARKTAELRDMEERLIETLGTKVGIIGSNNHGRIQIDYFSMEDLERIYEIIASDQ